MVDKLPETPKIQTIPLEVKFEKVSDSDQAHKKDQIVKLDVNSKDKVIFGSNDESNVQLNQKSISKKAMIMRVFNDQIAIRDMGSQMNAFIELEPKIKLQLTLKREIWFGVNNNMFKLYVNNINLPLNVTNNKNKELKSIYLQPPGTTVKEQNVSSNPSISLTLLPLSSKQVKIFPTEGHQLGGPYKIGNQKNFDWFIENKYIQPDSKKDKISEVPEVYIEIGYLKDEGWYIELPQSSKTTVKACIQPYGSDKNLPLDPEKDEEKKRELQLYSVLYPGALISLGGYSLRMQFEPTKMMEKK